MAKIYESEKFLDILIEHESDWNNCSIAIDRSRTVSDRMTEHAYVNVYHHHLDGTESPYLFVLLDVNYKRKYCYRALVFDVRDIPSKCYCEFKKAYWGSVPDRLEIVQRVLKGLWSRHQEENIMELVADVHVADLMVFDSV